MTVRGISAENRGAEYKRLLAIWEQHPRKNADFMSLLTRTLQQMKLNPDDGGHGLSVINELFLNFGSIMLILESCMLKREFLKQ